nr:DUF4913 domain-containing protein [Microbacterium sp. TPU 3598]
MSETAEDGFVVDELAIAAAAMDVAAAEKALHSAEEKADAADDALADANDDVTVAEAKVDDYTSDDAKLPWQVAAAQRELAKKTRAHARAARRHEEAHHELTPAQRKLDVALETLDAAKSTPVTEDDEDESSVSLLAWSVPLTTAPPELVEWVEGTFQDYLTGTIGLVKSGRWCIRWTEHPDAVHRLAGIYDEWTHMRLRIKGAPPHYTPSTARSSTTTSHNSPAASTASSNDATAPATNPTNAWTPTSPPPQAADVVESKTATGRLPERCTPRTSHCGVLVLLRLPGVVVRRHLVEDPAEPGHDAHRLWVALRLRRSAPVQVGAEVRDLEPIHGVRRSERDRRHDRRERRASVAGRAPLLISLELVEMLRLSSDLIGDDSDLCTHVMVP